MKIALSCSNIVSNILFPIYSALSQKKDEKDG